MKWPDDHPNHNEKARLVYHMENDRIYMRTATVTMEENDFYNNCWMQDHSGCFFVGNSMC